MNKRLMRNDMILIAVILAVVAVSAYFIYSPSQSDSVRVMVNNELYGEYTLGEDQTLKIGSTGVVLSISDGVASVIDSDCPDKSCVASPSITRSSQGGASIVCLPNRVAVIKSASDGKKEADGVAG